MPGMVGRLPQQRRTPVEGRRTCHGALRNAHQVYREGDRQHQGLALPGGGVGLRFTLARRNHVNLRVDYAWGKNSTALYVGVAEAF